MSEPDSKLSQDKKVAILLLTVDQELSARVLRHMRDDQLDRITRAMKQLQEMAIDHKTVASVLLQGVRRLRTSDLALGDVGNAVEGVLVKAFGEDRGANMSARANQDILARRPFAVFETLSSGDLANLLIEEHPQIAAVFLAHLDRLKAGDVINMLPEEKRSDLIFRVSTLDRTPPDVVQRVLDVMRSKVKNLGLTTLRSEPKAWIKAAAEILNNMGGGDKSILESISEHSEETASAIREEMFTFEDLGKLDKKSMQKILGQIDTQVLAISLKAAPMEVEDAIFKNLSKRAGEMVGEERDAMGPIPLSEVVEAQQQILIIIRDLIDKGEIKVMSAAEQLV